MYSWCLSNNKLISGSQRDPVIVRPSINIMLVSIILSVGALLAAGSALFFVEAIFSLAGFLLLAIILAAIYLIFHTWNQWCTSILIERRGITISLPIKYHVFAAKKPIYILWKDIHCVRHRKHSTNFGIFRLTTEEYLIYSKHGRVSLGRFSCRQTKEIVDIIAMRADRFWDMKLTQA